MSKPKRDLRSDVAAYSLWTYLAKGHLAANATIASLPGMYVTDLRRLEVVVGELDLGPELISQLQAEREWDEVWILAPLGAMGQAHATLRGQVDRLVPWWVVDHQVKFGSPEIP